MSAAAEWLKKARAEGARFREQGRELENAKAEHPGVKRFGCAMRGDDIAHFMVGPWLDIHRAVQFASKHLSVQLYMTEHETEPDTYWITES